MENKTVVADPASDVASAYEAPRLVPMGNLHDLLAGNGGTQFDCVDAVTTTGNGSVAPADGCNF
jgi:hypothetical protein